MCYHIGRYPGINSGPLLFVLFVNDLPLTVDRCNILMYADDTVLYFSAKTAVEIEMMLNKELKLVKDQIVDNSLSLHKGKTECALFGFTLDYLLLTVFQSLSMHIISRVCTNEMSWCPGHG